MIKAGVLGATGMVGQRFIELLSNHPWFEVSTLAASQRSANEKYCDVAKWRLGTDIPEEMKGLDVVLPDPKYVDADIVFSALPSDVAKEVEPKFAEAGFIVASNASAYRMVEDVPLLIPEVNADHLEMVDRQKKNRGWDGFIVTNPNCTTIMMAITLKPLVAFGIESVTIATMQAISGAGYSGVPSMAIVDNLIPFISGEEPKVETEPLKLLGEYDGTKVIEADFPISASCHRVAVIDGHTESIWVKMKDDPSMEEVKDVFTSFKGPIDSPTAPDTPIIVREEFDRPQPRVDRGKGGGMSVSVGRIRKSRLEGQIMYIAVGHNTIRGAAGASVLNAELMVEKGYLSK
ncbi:MAG: aspartate-semialdehyde dehydrogenase [Halobacteriota archaeon]|nr:aspartate-semialdehyde dehydrogenase [Halobacteriota archaeon]